MPDILTEYELKQFYEAVWKGENPSHTVLIKLLLFTGIRNSELVNVEITHVDLSAMRIRIASGKGGQDRYVPIPDFFRGELSQYIPFTFSNTAFHTGFPGVLGQKVHFGAPMPTLAAVCIGAILTGVGQEKRAIGCVNSRTGSKRTIEWINSGVGSYHTTRDSAE